MDPDEAVNTVAKLQDHPDETTQTMNQCQVQGEGSWQTSAKP